MHFGQVVILWALAPCVHTSTFWLAPYRIQLLLLMDKCTCKHLTFEFQFVLSELTSQLNSCPFHSPDTSHHFWYFVVCLVLYCICQIYGGKYLSIINIYQLMMWLCCVASGNLPYSSPTEGSGKTVMSYYLLYQPVSFSGLDTNFSTYWPVANETWILPAKLFFTSQAYEIFSLYMYSSHNFSHGLLKEISCFPLTNSVTEKNFIYTFRKCCLVCEIFLFVG